MKFLSLLLCFELVISPLRGSLFLPAEALAQTCPAGQAWNSSLGRCNVTQATLDTNNAVDSCGDDKTCLENVAKGKAGHDGNNSFNKTRDNGTGTKASLFEKGSGSTASAVAIGIPLLIVTSVLLSKKKGTKCRPASLMLMYAAAGALGVGEIYGYFNHKAKLDEINKKWDETIVHKTGSGVDKKKTEATEAQSQAFEFLAQNEDQVAKTAKTKKGFYIAATGLFAAGLAAAIVEQVQLGKAKAVIATPMPNDPSYPTRAAEARLKINNLTCSTDKDSNDKEKKAITDKEAKAKQDKLDADEKAAQASRDKSDKDFEAERDAKYEKMSTEECKANPACTKYQGDKEAGFNKRQEEYNKHQAEKAGREKPAAKQEDQKGEDSKSCVNGEAFKDPFSCEQANCNWHEDMGTGWCSSSFKPVSEKEKQTKIAIYKPTINTERMKKVAEHNLSTAKDAEQLLQLMNEMESVEFENYSKVSYIEEDMAKDLKKIPLISEITNHIATALVPNACAAGDSACSAADTAAAAAEEAAAAPAEEKKDNMGKILGVATTAIPLVMGLKSILGGVKSQGGVPLAPEKLEDIKSNVGNKIMTAIGKPYTRMAINGVLGGWMGLMAGHMNKQMKLAKERAKTLREMKEEFVSANGLLACKEEDRANSCKPICYCYTPDNKKNPARAKDTVCANRFSKMAYDPFGQGSQNDKVCLDQNSVVDPKCACRAKKNCMKITSGFSMKGFSPGTFKMISAGSAPAQDLLNGNLGGVDISDSAGINAARIKAAADQMLAKSDPKAAKEKDAFAASLEKGLIASGAGLSMGGGTKALPSSPAGAAAALDKELKDKKEDEVKQAGSRDHGADFNDEIEMPDAVATEDTGEDIEIAEVMEKEIDTGDSDINSGSHTNIFDVLSNRYKRSGMRRLFDEGSTAPADAPNKTEIVE